ncbi:hypothetical protein B296_00006746 [Ensete ventricosum]|uniref:40S ribosomal protein S16 n=1 Tax=Ensete ventricosum TaxID=4639 RepID=A0A427AB79_ENSVE|nr:hypothetical protein B296_00006746 [Ensete ventricosum]
MSQKHPQVIPTNKRLSEKALPLTHYTFAGATATHFPSLKPDRAQQLYCFPVPKPVRSINSDKPFDSTNAGADQLSRVKVRRVSHYLRVSSAPMATAAAATDSVQCFGRKKTAVAVAHCKRGRGLIKVNGVPIELVKPEILRLKAFEPILLLGRQRFAGVDIRIRVRGGGKTSQIYAIRQSIAKALVAFHQKYVDEQSKKEIKDILARYDRTLLVADPRRCEPKKFGGRGARARFQKSYR